MSAELTPKDVYESIRLVGIIAANVRHDVSEMKQSLALLTEAVGNQTAMISKLFAAVTEDREPSTLGDAMKELAAGVTQQAGAIETMALAIRDNTDRIEMQPEAFKHAVGEALDEREGKGA